MSAKPSISEEHVIEDEHDGIVEEDQIILTWPAIKNYAATRFSTLTELHLSNTHDLNPIPALGEMTLRNWNYFFMGFFAWFSASFDFFLTAVCGTQIAASLDVTTAQITWGLSAVLMVRSAGAVIFGFWTDKYSRKWPFITACAMFCALQLGTGFCNTYQQFMAVRAISGIAMGATYGTAAATSLEDAPVRARSFLSGLFFAAYPLGLIFAAIFWQAFRNTEKTWRSLFWFSSGIPLLLIIWRLINPETIYFTRVLKARQLIKKDQIKAGTYVETTLMDKVRNVGRLCAKYWVLFIYLIVLMTGPNYLTHATQDLYPTMLRKQLEFSEDKITLVIVITNLGGVLGSMVTGTIMEVLGRRLSVLLCCIGGGAMVYPAYMVQTTASTYAGGFFLFFFVIGVWGVLPAHLSEMSPPDARVLVSGLAYQLGNLASAASSTIETQLAERWPLEFDAEGVATKLNYAKVMTILAGAVFIFVIVCIFVGHEKFHRDLSSPVMKVYIEKVIQIEENPNDAESQVEDQQDNTSDQSSNKVESK